MAVAAKTAFLIRLTESETHLLPSDAAGNLADLTGDAASAPALELPDVVDALFGPGRQFGANRGLVGLESVVGSARLRRNMTVEAVADYDIASATLSAAGVLVARGRGGSAAERQLYGLQLVKDSDSLATLQMMWEDSGGSPAVVPGVQFEVPSGFLFLGAIRRWRSASEVDVEYVVNGESIGVVTSVTGDIADGDGGSVTLGCAGDGVGNYDSFFEGVIDHVRVSNVARTAEELRATYRLMTHHAEQGGEIARGLLPEGAYSEDPESVVQRELAVEGDALGFAIAKREELREDFYPDRAWSLLEDWETITRQFPKPGDTVAVRRARVVSFLRTRHGYSPSAVAIALAGPFDLAADDISIIEGTNRYDADFAADVPAWLQAVQGNGDAVAVSAGELVLGVPPAGAVGWVTGEPTYVEQAIDGDVLDEADHSLRADLTAKLSSVSLAAGMFAGLMAWNYATRDLLIFGTYNDGASLQDVWRVWSGGSWGALNVLEDPTAGHPLWIRLRYDGGTDWRLIYDDTGPSANPPLFSAAITGIADPRWFGVGMLHFGSATGVQSNANFDDLRAFYPNGLGPFSWFAYRDPGLGGSPDMPGARRVVRRIKPGHTQASAVQVQALLTDDPNSLTDDGPLGG